MTNLAEIERAWYSAMAPKKRRALWARYMASREWALLRREKMAQANGQCERCGAEASDIHHETYERRFHERLADLMAACRPCHLYLGGRGPDPIAEAARAKRVEALRRLRRGRGSILSGVMRPPDQDLIARRVRRLKVACGWSVLDLIAEECIRLNAERAGSWEDEYQIQKCDEYGVELGRWLCHHDLPRWANS